MPRCVLVLSVILNMLAATSLVSSQPPPALGFPWTFTPGKLHHGVFPGNEDRPELFNETYLNNYLKAVEPGNKLSWVYFSNEWDVYPYFPTEACTTIRNKYEATPYIRLMLRDDPYSSKTDNIPMPPEDRDTLAMKNSRLMSSRACLHLKNDAVVRMPKLFPPSKFNYTNILNGQFDYALREWGKAAAQWKHPVMVEWGTECNGDWFWWGAPNHGNDKGIKLFRQTYRHIIDRIKEGNGAAKNLIWVLHVDASYDAKNQKWNQHHLYHPGGDDIKWLAVTVYGGIERPYQQPTPFAEQFQAAYGFLKQHYPKLPILIAEMGTTRTRDQQDLVWLETALQAMETQRWPEVKGFAWWNDSYASKVPGGIINLRMEYNERLAGSLNTFLKKPVVAERPPVR